MKECWRLVQLDRRTYSALHRFAFRTRRFLLCVNQKSMTTEYRSPVSSAHFLGHLSHLSFLIERLLVMSPSVIWFLTARSEFSNTKLWRVVISRFAVIERSGRRQQFEPEKTGRI